MLLPYIRGIHARQKFKLKDAFEFIEFDDISAGEITETSPTPDQVEIWAAIKIGYTGEPPDSYRAINMVIWDWVEEHEEQLTQVIHEKLKEHFKEYYPNTDYTELDNGDSAIWMDQLDYMPRIDDDLKTIIIEVELIMDTEVLS